MKQNKKTSNKRSKLSARQGQYNLHFSSKHMLIFGLFFAGIASVLLFRASAYRTVGISNGSIYAFCSFSHRSNDDPIVFPGKTGAAHSHDFFGATSLNAFSTNDSIRQGGTSCHRPEDKSAYWLPTLYYNDQPINPKSSDVHDPTNYRITAVYGSDHQILKYMQPFPAGLRMIAGTASGGSAMAPNRHEPIWGWQCRNSTYVSQGDARTAPTCSESSDPKNFPQYLQLRLQFPSCWDGVNLDSPDHKSHMAYAFQQNEFAPANRCPASHPVQLPNLVIDISYYGVKGGTATRLSSGDMSTVHGDFMNGWEQNRFTELVNICLKRDVYCGGQKGQAENHNNEPEDVDDAVVQKYLNSPAGRQYISQAEKTLPPGSSPPSASTGSGLSKSSSNPSNPTASYDATAPNTDSYNGDDSLQYANGEASLDSDAGVPIPGLKEPVTAKAVGEILKDKKVGPYIILSTLAGIGLAGWLMERKTGIARKTFNLVFHRSR